MILHYTFDDCGFDYEPEFEELSKAEKAILNAKTKEELIEIINCGDGCNFVLDTIIEEDLQDYFRKKAYKEYLNIKDSDI